MPDPGVRFNFFQRLRGADFKPLLEVSGPADYRSLKSI